MNDGARGAADALISVIVVAHDSGATLARCVAALEASTIPYELIVIDNASRDGAPSAFSTRAPFTLLRNTDNPGFGIACNQGAARATGRWLLFLNPDCFVARDTLAQLRLLAEADPALGLIGADVRDARGMRERAARRRDPTPARVLNELVGRTHDGLYGAIGAGPLTAVDAVSGALMFMPRAAFERVGGFDPGFRLHAEDLDLCRRVRANGYVVAVAEQVAVMHAKGSSSRRRPLFVTWHKYRGLWRYYRRYEGSRASLLARTLVGFALVAGAGAAFIAALWRARRSA